MLNYLTGGCATISAATLGLLEAFDEPRSLGRPMDAAVNALQQLVDCDVLVEVGSPLGVRETVLDQTWVWGPEARYYHFASRQMTFETDLQLVNEELAARARAQAPPSAYTRRADDLIPLEGLPFDRLGEFWSTLLDRRTIRSFKATKISFDELSTVLRWTWGATHHIHHEDMGTHLLKTSPSGGARHAIEVYPVVLRVEGVLPGVYHYSTERDGLELIQAGQFDREVTDMCAGQPWVKRSAVVFLMTAVLPRTMWKYHQSHAYRVVHMDAGHLGQTFHLVCTRLGLAPFTTAALNAALIEETLGLDGVREIALYVACAGNEEPNVDGQQISLDLPVQRRVGSNYNITTAPKMSFAIV